MATVCVERSTCCESLKKEVKVCPSLFFFFLSLSCCVRTTRMTEGISETDFLQELAKFPVVRSREFVHTTTPTPRPVCFLLLSCCCC